MSSLREAKLDLVRYAQLSFGEFLKRTRESEQTITCFSKLTIGKLNPILVNRILRVGGRLEKAPISYDARHSIILPCVSHLTDIIIAHDPALAGLGGVSIILNLFIQKFWFLKSSAAVRRVIKNCMLCRKLNAKPGNQLMADLPDSRLQTYTHLFVSTGLDYCEPILIRQKHSQVKKYECIFTCLTTKAVRLVLAAGLSTDSVLNVLRRFLSRRGLVFYFCSKIRSKAVG